MGQFAKLFDIGDDQIVVMNTTNEEGNPMVKFTIVIEDNLHVGGPVEMTLGPTFEPSDDTQEAFDGCCKCADEYFDSIDEAKAEKVLIGMVVQYDSLLKEIE